MAARIKKGDNVIVLAGKDKGKKGSVLRVIDDGERAVVRGINIAKRHTKQRPGEPGGIVDKEASIHISNLSHVDPKTGQATRIGFKLLDNGRKVRFAKKSGEVIDL